MAFRLCAPSLKYGKLENGQCIKVPAALIKRRKLHFHSLECKVDVILGTNGFIWITATPPKVSHQAVRMSTPIAPALPSIIFTLARASQVEDSDKMEDDAVVERKPHAITADDRERICRVRNSILALARKFIAIHSSTIMDV